MTDFSNSILPAAARIVIPAQYLMSVYLLLRGHNLPGGGFIGGLVLASALVLRAMVDPSRAPKRDLISMAGVGLLLSLGAACWPLLSGQPFFTGVWGPAVWLPVIGKVKLGTVFFFDVGVFLVVTGVAAKMLLVLFAQHLDASRARAANHT